MWLEHNIVEFGEEGGDLRSYEVREYELDW